MAKRKSKTELEITSNEIIDNNENKEVIENKENTDNQTIKENKENYINTKKTEGVYVRRLRRL